MGSNTSKPSNDCAIQAQKNDLETASNSDPRSPTPEIIRTPLQRKTDAKHNITKNADLRKTFENVGDEDKLIHNNPILSAVIKNHLQSYDPRSPTQDFERTPIVISSKIDELADDSGMLQANVFGSPTLTNASSDDNIDHSYDSCSEAQEGLETIMPKNLCNGFMDITLNESAKVDEPLGSSTASNEAIENNLSEGSMITTTARLLETNFDCMEDLDSVDHVPTVDLKSEPSSLSKIPRFKVLNDDPRSPSTGIERTPIVVPTTTAKESIDNVEEMSDDTLIKVLQSTNAELRDIGKKSGDNFDGLLIYEDTSALMNDTPKKSRSDISSGSRTPLSCMKNKTDTGHVRSKSANTLQKGQSIIASKAARRASHIPRLKSLTKQTKLLPSESTLSLKTLSKVNIQGDCENTPPQSHRDKWDKDSSIVL